MYTITSIDTFIAENTHVWLVGPGITGKKLSIMRTNFCIFDKLKLYTYTFYRIVQKYAHLCFAGYVMNALITLAALVLRRNNCYVPYIARIGNQTHFFTKSASH